MRQRRFKPPPGVEVVSKNPMADAERLLRGFHPAGLSPTRMKRRR